MSDLNDFTQKNRKHTGIQLVYTGSTYGWKLVQNF